MQFSRECIRNYFYVNLIQTKTGEIIYFPGFYYYFIAHLIFVDLALPVGVPFYFLTRGIIGSSNAATGMCLLMLPAFLFAMYEKDGLPLEKVLKNMITVKFIRPPVRKYQMENLYEKKFIMVRKKKGGQKSVKKKKR